jgi:hypothetical protein
LASAVAERRQAMSNQERFLAGEIFQIEGFPTFFYKFDPLPTELATPELAGSLKEQNPETTGSFTHFCNIRYSETETEFEYYLGDFKKEWLKGFPFANLIFQEGGSES